MYEYRYPVLFSNYEIRHKKLRITFAVILSIVAIAIIAFVAYVSVYYHAGERARSIVSNDTEYYKIERSGNGLVFMPEAPIAGLIFYPGGKVEYTAYAPLMAELAKNGVACVLIEMPYNLAVFDMNAADGIIDMYGDIDKWYIGGHSLGGAMAATYVSKHTEDFDGLILLGAYSTADISGSNLNVISIYGSEDRVLNREKYDSCLSNLPKNFNEYIIDGGCHANFGDYGAQSGDGTPTISGEEQQKLTAEFIVRNL